jgi:hypothetical protein
MISPTLTEKVTFHFHRNNGLIAKAIKWRTLSEISHVSIEVRGCRYNAYLHKRFYRTLNHLDTCSNILESHSLIVDKATADAVEMLLIKSLHGKYDRWSIIGFILNRNLQQENRVNCAEIAMKCFSAIVGPIPPRRKLVSPDAVRTAVQFYNLGVESCAK